MKIACCEAIDSQNTNKKWPQILTILTVTLNTFVSGQLYAWTSVGIPYILSDDFPVEATFKDVSFIPFITPITACITGPIFAQLVDKIGRKPLIVFINIPYIASWLLIAFSNSLLPFYFYRFTAGIANAILFSAVPTYIGEIAEPNVRGSWGNTFSFNLYLGHFFINLIGSYVPIKTSALICATMPVLGIILMAFIPESPYFLLMKGKEEAAKRSLRKLRGTKNVEQELAQIKTDVERQISESGTWRDLFMIKTNRRALFIGASLRCIPYCSGIAVFIFYSQYIFQLSNGDLSQSTSSIIFTGCYVIISLFGSFILDKLGRRGALIISSCGSAVALTIESVFFYCREYTQLDTSSFGWVPLTGMLLYVIFYFLGLGTAPMLMLGELFSASIKGKALGAIITICAVVIVGTSIPFQILVSTYGLFIPFTIFALCTYLSILFIYCFVPETKGKTLEEIQQILLKKI